MAKARTKTPAARAVTADRAARLYRLLRFLAAGPRTRQQLTRHLKLDVRGFYRDLEFLRASGIELPLINGRYSFEGGATETDRLPFPDPHLTLGEARQISRGRSPAHRKIQRQIKDVVG